MADDGKKRRRPVLDGGLGMSRREMLRRSAIAGGTLLWAAPVLQSLAPSAHAQAIGQSPGQCSACYCWSGADKENPSKETGLVDDFVSQFGQANAQNCDDWCKHVGDFGAGGQYAGFGAVNGPYQFSEWCSGTGCQVNIRATHPHGAHCT